MTEKRPAVLTPHQMLEDIDPRVVRGVRELYNTNPGLFEEQALTAYAGEILPEDIRHELRRFVHSEEHKHPPRLGRDVLGRIAAGVAIAHVWHVENQKAREQHRALPHK